MNQYENYKAIKNFSSLNGLRAFCILAVLWHHSINIKNLPNFFSLGFLGVDMFYIVSGFLIVTLILREKEKTGVFSLSNFYRRRALRIMPIYYGLILIITILYFVFKAGDPDTKILIRTLPWYILFISNFSIIQANNMGIFWSLATEQQFYLIWPFLEKFTKKSFLLIFGIVFFIINQLINFGVLDFLFGEMITLSIFDATYTPILFGVGLAYLLHHENSFKVASIVANRTFFIFITSVALLILLNLVRGDISGIQRLLIQVAMTIYLASLVINNNHRLSRLYDNRVMNYIGKISYGMYIYHLFILSILKQVIPDFNFIHSDFIILVVGTIITIIVSGFSYRYFELFFLKKKSVVKT